MLWTQHTLLVHGRDLHDVQLAGLGGLKLCKFPPQISRRLMHIKVSYPKYPVNVSTNTHETHSEEMQLMPCSQLHHPHHAFRCTLIYVYIYIICLCITHDCRMIATLTLTALMVTKLTTHTDLERLIPSNGYEQIPQTGIDTQHAVA